MPNNKAAGFELFNPKQLNTALEQGNFNPIYARPGTVERGMANAEAMARKQFISNKRRANYGISRGPAFNAAVRSGQEYWLKKALGNNARLNGYGSSPSSVGSSSSPVFPVNPRPANAVETGGRKKTMRAKKAKKAKKHTRRR